jgi:basic amino acid/polyamine antiporter, APA family
LLQLRYRGAPSNIPHVTVPIWIPVTGFVTCLVMMTAGLVR